METKDFNVWTQGQKEATGIVLFGLALMLGMIIYDVIITPAETATPTKHTSTAVLILNIDGSTVWREPECNVVGTTPNVVCERRELFWTLRVKTTKNDIGAPPTVLLYSFRCGSNEVCTIEGPDLWMCVYEKAASVYSKLSSFTEPHCHSGYATGHWVVTERTKIPGGESLFLARSHL